MEVMCNPKGGRTATPAFLAMLVMIMIMMLLNAYCCGASVLAKSNTSFRCSSGRLDECRLIEEDLELELEFLINPYVSRILTVPSKGPNYSDKNKGAFSEPCGKSGDRPGYTECVHQSTSDKRKCHRIDTYMRCGNP